MNGYGDERSRTAGFAIWLVRLVLVAASIVALWQAVRAYEEHLRVYSSTFRYPAASYWTAVALFAGAGLAFGLALRIPFPRPRVAWGRFVFVPLALVPAVHLWVTLGLESAPRFLRNLFWFDSSEVAFVGAALAGVAVASSIGARRGKV